MEKKKLTETDVRTKSITPALIDAGWDLHTQIREEVALTSGRILVKGQKLHIRILAALPELILKSSPGRAILARIAYIASNRFEQRLEDNGIDTRRLAIGMRQDEYPE